MTANNTPLETAAAVLAHAGIRPMNVYELTECRDYDCVAANIHCRADREGAQVIEITSGNCIVRALAHSEPDAREAADYYAAQWLDGTP